MQVGMQLSDFLVGILELAQTMLVTECFHVFRQTMCTFPSQSMSNRVHDCALTPTPLMWQVVETLSNSSKSPSYTLIRAPIIKKYLYVLTGISKDCQAKTDLVLLILNSFSFSCSKKFYTFFLGTLSYFVFIL
jgi:hypothetical protein